ncbi:pseudouridine synthase [Eremococcus coleocola]|uniref:Pseudouridine synthase n=1 Tax=Eremococcus coleocola ACS-139-V-Col8 TaxID=908337 RepID=E4KLV9_9LACT|nr:pseudouridine synthase [Eremococcus coleocola]EFR31992.1 pseudouridine synthase B, ribosomal large subunit [Eremococcus coleocola ACS-139-V-Col8]
MERLQKVMAHAGIASRRKCEEIISQGRVTVNGQTVTELGFKVKQSDKIEVDQVPIYLEEPRYFLFYKPRNVISAVSDDKGRPVVLDYFKHIDQRIYPIGRLDFDTTGLLLLTNDGEFANQLMHPRYQVDKVYVAKLDKILDKEALRKLERGIIIDGKKTSKARAKVLDTNLEKKMSVVQLTIHEGWNHQVKKMFEAVGAHVVKLKREKFGPLNLGKMQPGEYRELLPNEVTELKNL